MSRILVAHDDKELRQSFFSALKDDFLVNTVPYAWADLHCKVQRYNLLIIGGPKPKDLLLAIRGYRPELPIVVIPANGLIEIMWVEVLKMRGDNFNFYQTDYALFNAKTIASLLLTPAKEQ